MYSIHRKSWLFSCLWRDNLNGGVHYTRHLRGRPKNKRWSHLCHLAVRSLAYMCDCSSMLVYARKPLRKGECSWDVGRNLRTYVRIKSRCGLTYVRWAPLRRLRARFRGNEAQQTMTRTPVLGLGARCQVGGESCDLMRKEHAAMIVLERRYSMRRPRGDAHGR
jgi:hypothetical protein